jgi:translation initiation factor 6
LPVGRTLVAGSPYLGIYLKASDRIVVAPPSAPAATVRQLERLLGVESLRTTVADSEIVGALLAMNSHGTVADQEIGDAEVERLSALGPVLRLASRHNAVGNNILVNDHGAVVHPEYSDEAVRRLAETLQVPVERGTVAGLGTVGMAAITTNKGTVTHPRATPNESELLESVLKVPVHRSTANFGVPVVGACLVANTRGFVTGRPTTPVEIVHLQEGLGILD